MTTKAEIEELKKGVQNGDAEAMFLLGYCYLDGVVVEENEQEAIRLWELAAEKGNVDSMNSLGMILENSKHPQDRERTFQLYRKAAETSLDGLCNLGHCYSDGIGTDKDDKKAVECYRIAAENGSAQGQYDLAVCYRNGEGVKQDFAKAVELYEKAIAQGHSNAMSNLGLLYDNGIGVEVDKSKAIKYYQMSAENGNMQGQFLLGSKYFYGDGIEQNYEEAVKWFAEAAQQGEPDSMYHLAICHNKGLGVEKDVDFAIELLYMSADCGWQPAIDVINENGIRRPKK